MVKPLSEQLSDLSVHAKKAEDDVAAAKNETHDKIVARREQLRAATTQTVEKFKQDMTSASSAVSGGFSALKAKASADVDALKANVSQWKKEVDAKRAENRADELEREAGAAIDYAISSIEQAKLAAIDAVIGRLQMGRTRMGRVQPIARSSSGQQRTADLSLSERRKSHEPGHQAFLAAIASRPFKRLLFEIALPIESSPRPTARYRPGSNRRRGVLGVRNFRCCLP